MIAVGYRAGVTLHHEMSRNVPDGHFPVLCFLRVNFYAIYNGENHFQIRGQVAELHAFEYCGTTYGTFGKTCFKCSRLLCKNNRMGLKKIMFLTMKHGKVGYIQLQTKNK